jgi:peptide/nickel transport system permease protein
VSIQTESPLSIENLLEPSPGALLRRRIFGHYSFMFGAIVLTIIILMALLAPLLAPHDPYGQSLSTRLINPIWHADGVWNHVLGSDGMGRDYLSRMIYGAQISLLIGFLAMIISGLIGTTLGVAAGYFGGRLDMFITFLITVRLSMPLILVALAVIALVGGSLQVIICVIGFLIWDRFAVVMRASTQQIREVDYVNAAKAAGCSTLRILLTEIMPNIANNLIVVVTLEMARAVLLEAALSFLGLGLQPPLPSWGLMVAEGRDFMFFQPWLITIPGIALFMLVLSVNLLGDGIRDVTAPESRG